MAKWKCTVCGYIYDEELGDVNAGAAAGTKFADLPADWTCPVCGAPKDAFEIVPGPVPDRLPERIDSKNGGGETIRAAGTTVSEVLIDELAKWGVDLVFGLPGTSSLGLVDAIRKNPSIRYIVVRHEENAAMAASAYNKLTGKIAGCLTIAGPGATNLTTGLYDAKEDHASVISLNGQVEAQYTGPGGIQEIDQDAFFRPITVYNNTVYEKNVAVLLLDRALKYATVSHGVAQLSVPNDIQKQPLDAQSCIRESCIRSPDIIPTDEAMKRAADAINAAVKPVILAGWGASGTGADILSLAERLRAPVLTTFRAKGIVPEDNPWVIGILGNVGSPQARNLATSADLIITLGVGFSKFTNVPAGKAMVQVDTDPIKLGKNEHSIPLWGNARYVLPRLLPLVKERPAGNARAEIASMKTAWNAQRDGEADSSAVPLRPPFIMKVLTETIPEDAVISVDVGENQWWFGRNFRMKHQRFCMSGYLATMGFGFPGAIAAKIAYPDKPVFCITGDGGFSMAMGDFVTAIKYKLPMVVIILNNRQLGMIQVEQMQEHYPNYATDLLNPDFARYAEVCGGVGIRVEKPEDLKPAIVKAMGMDRPVIVDVSTDPKRF